MLDKKLIIFCINKKQFVGIILTNFSKETVKKHTNSHT